ncbi:hypothetical protein AURDEDRAFT_131283 [Auricularia subglabra TFB-10046 SS5]|uniref:Uncharacterized protein n=1 Tax=Auricularia subglabra (strain TFB-10046 / SS5) TaxID=717982 RepID=J0WP86_AURST|nr:hypothetical protein AURDEDRAFT_131283 [Auricularia subglabra TFB-10046 SS5]
MAAGAATRAKSSIHQPPSPLIPNAHVARMTSPSHESDPASPASSRPSNRWQQLRALADLSVVVAEGLSLQHQIKDVLHESGFSSKLQPASRVPRAYAPDDLGEQSDVESELDERDAEYDPGPSRADRRALANMTVAIGLRPPSGKRAPRALNVPSTRVCHGERAAATTNGPPNTGKPKKTKGKKKRNGRSSPRSPSPRQRSRTPEDGCSPPPTRLVPLPLPLADEGPAAHKRPRRGMGRRRQPRANLNPAQKLAAKAEDKQRRKRSRLSRLHAILMSAETTQRRMRSQTAQAAKDRRLAAPRMIALLKAAVTVRADIPIERMFHGSSYFSNTYYVRSAEIGHSSADTEPAQPLLHPECNEEVRRLVQDQGYLYVANDLDCPQMCLDKNRRPFAIKPRQPQGPWYRQSIARVESLLTELRGKLKLQSNSPNVSHTRGQFPRFTFGASHGGGQERPTRIAPDWSKHNERLIEAFLADPDVIAVIQHIESAYCMGPRY